MVFESGEAEDGCPVVWYAADDAVSGGGAQEQVVDSVTYRAVWSSVEQCGAVWRITGAGG